MTENQTSILSAHEHSQLCYFFLHNFSCVSGTESYQKQAAEADSVGENTQTVQLYLCLPFWAPQLEQQKLKKI